FSRVYYVPTLAINRYDVRLNAEFQILSVLVLPDLHVRASELYLTYLGFHPGPVDGVAGEHTLSALADFQAQQGLQKAGVIDQDLVSQLQDALPTGDDMPRVA